MIFNEFLDEVDSTWLDGTKLMRLNGVLFDNLIPVGIPAPSAAQRCLQTANDVLWELNFHGGVDKRLYKFGYCAKFEKYHDGRRLVWNTLPDRRSHGNILACYKYLDHAVAGVIKTKAGKQALIGTEFECLAK